MELDLEQAFFPVENKIFGHVSELIAMQMLRDQHTEVAHSLIKEAGLKITKQQQNLYVHLNKIVAGLENEDCSLALEWATQDKVKF